MPRTHPLAASSLGALLAGKRQLPEAAREFERAVQLKPGLARAHLDLARVLADEGEMPPAIEHLRKAAAGSDRETAQAAAEALRRLGR